MPAIKVWGYICERCGHMWTPRELEPATKPEPKDGPMVCPKCKSPYWNKPRGQFANSRELGVRHG